MKLLRIKYAELNKAKSDMEHKEDTIVVASNKAQAPLKEQYSKQRKYIIDIEDSDIFVDETATRNALSALFAKEQPKYAEQLTALAMEALDGRVMFKRPAKAKAEKAE